MVVEIRMDNGVEASILVDERLLNVTCFPIDYVLNAIQPALRVCFERRFDKEPERDVG